jgi:two-component system cell cycle sensor histidine kinase/response regulator CckA
MSLNLKVLLIEDCAEDERSIARVLSGAGYQPSIRRVETEEALRLALASQPWDVILCNYQLPELTCEQVLRNLDSSDLDTPLIALSQTVNEEAFLTLVRAGARDHILKDNLAMLPGSIKRELRESEGRKQRKKYEVQLQQASRMEAVGRLAAGVAHDFNNLLTVITGFAQLALLDENPAQAGLEQILHAAERAAGLTRQLLAFSRQQSLEPRIFDLNQLVRDLNILLVRLIGEDIEVLTRLADEPLAVKADPGQMEQVVLNLAINARDAMPRGGKLIISTSRRRLDGENAIVQGLPDNDYCVISISDNGCGIAPDVLPHIFEPFFTTKAEGEGTGLGLATVYGIVQQSGGAIHAYSEKGTGTTMTVLIPSATGPSEVAKARESEPMGIGDETVLIAEDDVRVLKLVSQCLSARGFKVLEAANGEDAWEILRARGVGGVDLLVTDVVMPVLTGPVLGARAIAVFPQLKILFMSGYTEEVIQQHGVTDGNSAFLQKPFAPRDLVRTVRQLLDMGQKALTG